MLVLLFVSVGADACLVALFDTKSVAEDWRFLNETIL
jgi:hypothetical protein